MVRSSRLVCRGDDGDQFGARRSPAEPRYDRAGRSEFSLYDQEGLCVLSYRFEGKRDLVIELRAGELGALKWARVELRGLVFGEFKGCGRFRAAGPDNVRRRSLTWPNVEPGRHDITCALPASGGRPRRLRPNRKRPACRARGPVLVAEFPQSRCRR